MNDLKSIVEQQTIENPQPTKKYKIIGIVFVLLILCMAYGCVHGFKILTFLNDIVGQFLFFLNRIVLSISSVIRELINLF